MKGKRRRLELNAPPDHRNIGCINSFQGFLDTVNRLLKVNRPIWIIIGRNCYMNRGICSKVSSVSGTGKLDLNDLEETGGGGGVEGNVPTWVMFFFLTFSCRFLTSVISGTSSAKISTRSTFTVSPGAKLTSPEAGWTSSTASLPLTVACHCTTTVPMVPALRTIGKVTSAESDLGSSTVTGRA